MQTQTENKPEPFVMGQSILSSAVDSKQRKFMMLDVGGMVAEKLMTLPGGTGLVTLREEEKEDPEPPHKRRWHLIAEISLP